MSLLLIAGRMLRSSLLLFFSLIGSAALLQAGTFGAPSEGKLNDQGTVAFKAGVRVRDGAKVAIFLSLKNGSISPVVTTGEAAPTPGFRFSALSPTLCLSASCVSTLELNNQNNLIFSAPITDSKSSIEAIIFYFHAQKVFVPVLTGLEINGKLESPFSLTDQNEAAFVFGSRLFIFRADSRELIEVARVGAAAPGGNSYSSFSPPVLNNLGTVAFVAKLNTGDVGIFRKFKSAPVERLLTTGDPFPSMPGATLEPLGSTTLNDLNTIVFGARLKNVASAGGLFALLSDGRLVSVALDKQEIAKDRFLDMMKFIPGILSPGRFEFGPPSFHLDGSNLVAFSEKTNQGSAVFFSRVREGVIVAVLEREVQAPRYNDRQEFAFSGIDKIFFRDQSGELREFPISSRPVPGISGASLIVVTRLFINNREEVGFEATVKFEGQDPSATRYGIFVLDTKTGEIRRVAVQNEFAPGTDPLSLLVFPQFGDGHFEGGSMSTSILLMNPSQFAFPATVRFLSCEGKPVPVRVGEVVNTTFSVVVPELGSIFIQTSPSPSLQSGYVLVEGGAQLDGVEIFSIFDASGRLKTEAGVLPSSPALELDIPVEVKEDVNTGLALVNLNREPAQLTFEARDPDGVVVAIAQKQLDPSNHLARFVGRELFPEIVDFRGTVKVRSSAPLYSVTLRTTARTITSFPVLQ